MQQVPSLTCISHGARLCRPRPVAAFPRCGWSSTQPRSDNAQASCGGGERCRLMPFGNSAEEEPCGTLQSRRRCNPKGIVSTSPGLRGTSYPELGAAQI